jgi:hypothetical protein
MTEETRPVEETMPDCAIIAPGALKLADWLLMVGVALVVLGAVLVPQLGRVYPFTYDELIYLYKTRAYDDWLAGRLVDENGRKLGVFSMEAVEAAETLKDMHPGFAKFVGVIPRRLVRSVLGVEGGGRMTGALFLAFGCCVLYWMLVGSAGRIWAAVGAFGLASMPRVFGHAHFHALDIPVMSMSLLAAGVFYYSAHHDRWGPALVSGALVGLALSTKLTAAAAIIHIGLWLLFRRPPGWVKAICGLVVAPFVFLAMWPWLWPDLFGRLARYMAFHSDHFKIATTYFGQVYGDTNTAPWHYPWMMLLLTLPATWTLAALGGLGAQAKRRLPAPGMFFALGILANLVLLSLPGATRYGGMRLILSVYPFVVGLGVLAVVAARRAVPANVEQIGALTAALLLLGPAIIGCIGYYPYCLSYYTGGFGLRGAAGEGMEITYWGDAFGGARDFMSLPGNADDRFYASNELATGVIDALIRVGEIPPQHRMLGYFVKDQIPEDADWILVDNHPPMWSETVEKLVATQEPFVTIEIGDVPLLWIFRAPRDDTGGTAGDGVGPAAE